MNKASQRLAPVPDPFNGMLGSHLRRSSVIAMTDLAESLAPLKLKPVEYSILSTIAFHPGSTQSEVGKALGILRANMAPIIATLTKKGLIDREPVDGRSQALRLSAAGHAVCRRALNITREHEERVFGALSPAARTRMIAQLRALWQPRS